MVSELGRVLDVYEEKVALPLPEKFPKPTRVHAHQGEPCPRCETVLEAVFYEDYVMTLLPALPDRGPDPQGPAALPAAQVAAGQVSSYFEIRRPSRSRSFLTFFGVDGSSKVIVCLR